MTRSFYKNAVGAFIMFDMSRRVTFTSVSAWKRDLDRKVRLSDGTPLPVVLLASKVFSFLYHVFRVIFSSFFSVISSQKISKQTTKFKLCVTTWELRNFLEFLPS